MQTNRRDFILKTAALAGLAALPTWLKGAELLPPDSKHIGVQLYTLRDLLQKDPKSVLAALAMQGYTQLEGYGGADGKYFGMGAKEFGRLVQGLGMSIRSWHVSGGWGEDVPEKRNYRSMLKGWGTVIDDLKMMGAEYAVVPYIPKEYRADLSSYNKIAEQFNNAAALCYKAGVQFCYHNHEFEFVEMEGAIPYEILLRNTDEKLVKFELDLYWATKAKVEPVYLFKQASGRFPLWHVKDMAAETMAFAEVGRGTIDFKSLFDASEVAGLEYFFVEQDKCPGDPLESTAISIKNLKETILK